MTWIAYAVGGYGAAYLGFDFDLLTFWIGYLFLFFLEVAVVFTNDFHDYESDRINKNYSPFTGGSRVLVDDDLSKADRSEEHTSELQSRGHLVCRLLLEKKKIHTRT